MRDVFIGLTYSSDGELLNANTDQIADDHPLWKTGEPSGQGCILYSTEHFHMKIESCQGGSPVLCSQIEQESE